MKKSLVSGFLVSVSLLGNLAQAAENYDERLLRGSLQHDQICRGCHEHDTYTQRHLSRNPYFDLRGQTKLWLDVVKVKWTDAEIDDVVYFLKQTYYSESKNSR